MAIKTIDDANLVAIGNAIREKNGTTDTYTPSQMAAAISAIQIGGGNLIYKCQTDGKTSYVRPALIKVTCSVIATNPYHQEFDLSPYVSKDDEWIATVGLYSGLYYNSGKYTQILVMNGTQGKTYKNEIKNDGIVYFGGTVKDQTYTTTLNLGNYYYEGSGSPPFTYRDDGKLVFKQPSNGSEATYPKATRDLWLWIPEERWVA